MALEVVAIPLRRGPSLLEAVYCGKRDKTENHGVPGSIPGPATSKMPANGRKTVDPRLRPGLADDRLTTIRPNELPYIIHTYYLHVL
jgi:hypothetical protein